MRRPSPPPLRQGQVVTWKFNPYFDEYLIFPSMRVITQQETYYPVKVEEGRQLYAQRGKRNASAFIERVRRQLAQQARPWWPYAENLFLSVAVMGPTSVYKTADLDNIAKTLCDALKGVVLQDDRQITTLYLSKHLIDLDSGTVEGVQIGIRRMVDGELPQGMIYHSVRVGAGEVTEYDNIPFRLHLEGKAQPGEKLYSVIRLPPDSTVQTGAVMPKGD